MVASVVNPSKAPSEADVNLALKSKIESGCSVKSIVGIVTVFSVSPSSKVTSLVVSW